MNTPSLVVLGAMKAGTTTAYEYLSARPGVVMLEKESGWLRSPRDVGVNPTVDVCSDYMRLHRFPELLAHARASLPIDTPMLYILRDPVERAISHARHLTSLGPVDIDSVFDIEADVVQTSSYGRQLIAWTDAGYRNITIVDFHHLASDLPAAIDRHLGVEPTRSLHRVTRDVHANPTSSLRSTRPFVRPIVRSRLYRAVKRFLPSRLRDAGKRSALTAPAVPIDPTPAQLQQMIDHFTADLAQLCNLGITTPSWCSEWADGRAPA